MKKHGRKKRALITEKLIELRRKQAHREMEQLLAYYRNPDAADAREDRRLTREGRTIYG